MKSASNPEDTSSKTKNPAKTMGLAGVFAIFFLLGCAGLAPIAWQANRDYRTAKVYVESTAEILDYIPITTGVHTRPGERRDPRTRPSFVFRFNTKEGETVTTRGYDSYGGREAPMSEANQFKIGSTYPVWYDPAKPKRAVLSRRFNPHFYWVLGWPLGMMLITGLLLRESLRRAAPPVLKGVQKGRRLAWRLPPVATQRAMAGCLGVAMVIMALLTSGFTMAALDYKDEVYRYRWISHVLGFNMNGWYIVAFVAAVVTIVFIWAFLVNLRWAAVPEPEVEVDDTRLMPGDSTSLRVVQGGPFRAESYVVSLICEINGTPGKPPAIKEVILERKDVRVATGRLGDAEEIPITLTIPGNARHTRKSAADKQTGPGNGATKAAGKPRQGGDLVGWFIRVERKVSPKMTLQGDYEILVGPEAA